MCHLRISKVCTCLHAKIQYCSAFFPAIGGLWSCPTSWRRLGCDHQGLHSGTNLSLTMYQVRFATNLYFSYHPTMAQHEPVCGGCIRCTRLTRQFQNSCCFSHVFLLFGLLRHMWVIQLSRGHVVFPVVLAVELLGRQRMHRSPRIQPVP